MWYGDHLSSSVGEDRWPAFQFTKYFWSDLIFSSGFEEKAICVIFSIPGALYSTGSIGRSRLDKGLSECL